MVRSLLLGSAAGLLAVAGAQAADLPVKAKPVQYVKICDLYGAGYYYIPGTETCIKIGGYVRVNAFYNATGGFVYAGSGAFGGNNALFNRRDTSSVTFRARTWLTADTRSQTAWGTLRSYYALQFTNAGAGDTATGTSMVRAFIQVAGFTVGRAVSAFDLPSANSPLTNNIAGAVGSTTGPTGINVFQYTAQFGNGISATISVESQDQRQRPVVNLSAAGNQLNLAGVASIAGGATSQHQGVGGGGGGSIPDFAANIDVTQAWGAARIAGALHRVDAAYYASAALCGGLAANINTNACAGPSSKWGYALGAGFTITQIPGLPGDLIGASFFYTKGANGYGLGVPNVSVWKGGIGGRVAFGSGAEAVYVNGSGLELTRTWSFTAAYQHAWAPNLKTSIYGGYTSVDFNAAATAMICPGAGVVAGSGGSITVLAGGTCNPDFSYWQLGSRLFQWTPVQNLDIGLDIVYSRFRSAFAGPVAVTATSGQAAGIRTAGDRSVWEAVLEVRRSFWP